MQLLRQNEKWLEAAVFSTCTTPSRKIYRQLRGYSLRSLHPSRGEQDHQAAGEQWQVYRRERPVVGP
jgi:hypothetical protein